MVDDHKRDENWQRLVDELNAFELDPDYPVTKEQKRQAAEKRQKQRSDELMRLSKIGSGIPRSEIVSESEAPPNRRNRKRGKIVRVDSLLARKQAADMRRIDNGDRTWTMTREELKVPDFSYESPRESWLRKVRAARLREEAEQQAD